MRCDTCNHETDNGLGFCNFCRTPFPPTEDESTTEDSEDVDPEALEPSSLA